MQNIKNNFLIVIYGHAQLETMLKKKKKKQVKVMD